MKREKLSFAQWQCIARARLCEVRQCHTCTANLPYNNSNNKKEQKRIPFRLSVLRALFFRPVLLQKRRKVTNQCKTNQRSRKDGK